MNCGERWHCFFKEKSGQKRKKKREIKVGWKII